ncbi:MAG: tyrosine-protein phosphatase [Solobacterium sp.]|nr:tyrosine-protein phosphatase [Solobacterium sp.]
MTFGVTEEIGKIVLDAIFNEYGSVEIYFEKEFNINRNELQRLRSLYTE